MPVNSAQQKGFTLVELILGMVVFAIALTIVTSLIAPQAKQSAEPLIQLKAAKLAQATMNEILAKSYDENSDRSPPFLRCDEKPSGCSNTLGPEEGSRDLYDDVDDYHNLVISDVGGEYPGFSLSINVAVDGDYDQTTTDAQHIAKRIDVVVNTPIGERYAFQAYRGNF